MTICRRTTSTSRTQLVFKKYGLVMEYLRPKVGGGWYVKNSITLPWMKKGLT